MEALYIPLKTAAERKKAEAALNNVGIKAKLLTKAQVEDMGLVNAIKVGMKTKSVPESSIRALLNRG